MMLEVDSPITIRRTQKGLAFHPLAGGKPPNRSGCFKIWLGYHSHPHSDSTSCYTVLFAASSSALPLLMKQTLLLYLRGNGKGINDTNCVTSHRPDLRDLLHRPFRPRTKTSICLHISPDCYCATLCHLQSHISSYICISSFLSSFCPWA